MTQLAPSLVLMPQHTLVIQAQWRNASLPVFLVMFIIYFYRILFGAIIERGILKRMYDKDEIVLVLVTYQFSISEDLIKLIWV